MSGSHSNDSSGSSSGGSTIRRHRIINNIWRSSSLSNLVSNSRLNRVLQSSSPDIPSDLKSIEETDKRGWNAIVTIVVVEAMGLPDPPSDSSTHHVYCKIRLGTQTRKSKSVPSARNPVWRDRLQLHLNSDHILRISIWDKGKQKNFMGSCIVDMSSLEKERAHEIWKQLDDGFGSVHLNVAACTTRNDNVSSNSEPELQSVKEEFALLNLTTDWKVVGQLSVKVIGARGLSGKPNAYCTLELDNERVQTPISRAGSEPMWNKNYLFNVYDVTSTLDIKVHDNSLVNSLRMEYLGKVSIPLLRVSNGATRWYALKDKSKRNNAKGNCPRVLLEMTVIWNPVKAAIRLFQPKEVKYIKKSPKFDIALVHTNLEFIRDVFNFLYELNERYKRFLEWENKDLCSIFLAAWLIFWYHFELWIVPLLLLLPFLYHLIIRRYSERERYSKYTVVRSNLDNHFANIEYEKNDKLLHSLTDKIQNLPEMTVTITNGNEFIASLAERFYNLVAFEVPFLSFLTMIFLGGSSIVLYFIPIKYLLMILGTYKYTRKQLNPQRTPNNDLLDFISRIPDFEMMKDWRELTVPEPSQQTNSAMSTSSTVRDIVHF